MLIAHRSYIMLILLCISRETDLTIILPIILVQSLSISCRNHSTLIATTLKIVNYYP